MEDMNTMSGALDWNSEITQESEFELLPEGTYDFTVESMERGQFNGSEKMSACPKADLTLAIVSPQSGKIVRVYDTLFLHSKAEWRLSQFFTGIGEKKKGEPLRMNWLNVPGATGRAEISVNKYKRNDGSTGENNRVVKYLPKEFKHFTPGQF